MILQNIRYLVTQNEDREVLENIDLRVEDSRITEIGKNLSGKNMVKVDCSDRIIMPGLVNAHTHVSMALLRGISDNKGLDEWLNEDIFPAEEAMGEYDAYVGALLGAAEMLKSGTTTFNDMYFHMDSVAKAVENSGIRALLSKGMTDMEDEIHDQLREALDFVKNYGGEERINVGIAPHAIYTCSNELLSYGKHYSEMHDIPFHIHVSETLDENKDVIEEHGMSPIEYLDSHGLLDEQVIAAHGTWLSKNDRKIIAEKNVSVAHNPAANLKLGSGIADVNAMRENGINIGLGTDGPASNNSLNLFQEMKLTGLLHKRDDPTRITEQEVLDMATVNSARALGLEEEIGSIEKGKKADLVMISTDEPSMSPVYGKRGVVSNLVFSFNGGVSEVLVGGELVVENGNCVEIDEETIVDEAERLKQKLV